MRPQINAQYKRYLYFSVRSDYLGMTGYAGDGPGRYNWYRTQYSTQPTVILGMIQIFMLISLEYSIISHEICIGPLNTWLGPRLRCSTDATTIKAPYTTTSLSSFPTRLYPLEEARHPLPPQATRVQTSQAQNPSPSRANTCSTSPSTPTPTWPAPTTAGA